MTLQPDWQEIERLFNATVDLPVHERQGLLNSASAPVRAEVESLLETDDQAFLGLPPVHLAADLLESQPDALTSGQIVGNYKIESLVTRGGMGEVYLARDPSGIPIALKILRRHLIVSAQAIDRFQTEARAASALHHPNIVTICGSGDSPAGLFIAMEWVEGPTFRQLMDEGVPDNSRAVDLCGQAARALAVAHEAGILHRDIKPENIIVRNDGVLKVLDFGLARLSSPVRLEASSTGASGTISGTLSGTLLYMPPEILRGEMATRASDVFSLGALFYELWAGRHPFEGETPLDVFEAIECRLIGPPSTVRTGVPPAIDALILQMLDRNPERRPSASEACAVFNRFSAKP